MPKSHPLNSLTPDEITACATAVQSKAGESSSFRFVAISLVEPPKNAAAETEREAEVIVINRSTGIASQFIVGVFEKEGGGAGATVSKQTDLPPGVQPLLTPEDCDLAEEIAKKSTKLAALLESKYGIKDIRQQVAADPWSVHLADDEDENLATDEATGKPRRLVQTFLYARVHGKDLQDNHYAHPIPLVPVVDLNSEVVIRIDGEDRDDGIRIPQQSVNYHRDLLDTNSYLETVWRADILKALHITQPDGPSFTVTDVNLVEWQGWSLRVGFHYREGIVLHDVEYQGRSVMKRGSLVEMCVPYGDPHAPFQRKCALDVGDYGLGYCANSLELGCDCLGHIHYFDANLISADGSPKLATKVVCMHEEDDGLLWKHVEYRNGHSEARRARELVISSIATVVNYEYLFYWRLKLDGSIDFEIRLSGELSTNLISPGEDAASPSHGILVAPGVNAQTHQHMFCARLDMAVDGTKNIVSEVDIETEPNLDPVTNRYGNVFGPKETVLRTEQEAVRTCNASKARTWKIANAEGKVNPVSGKAVAYKLIPFTRGPAGPPLLTHPMSCNVTKKSKFATANLWVTKYDATERYPAGDYPTQAKMETIRSAGGLPSWIESRNAILGDGEDVVLWHSFGVTHVPRPEDFPVMPCEKTGFTLKPDGFFAGNPSIDLPPDVNKMSKVAAGSCNGCMHGHK